LRVTLWGMIQTSTVPQREIARRLGITQAAVSMALSGSRRISSTTREKVAALAAELGYTRLPRRRRVVPNISVAENGVVSFEPGSLERASWTG
jgi:DNA-binding LacI/PurR family transcriptional regulator